VIWALVFSFHCLPPLTNADGRVGTDSVHVLSRVVGLPLPYRFVLDDSVSSSRIDRYVRSYPLQGTAAATDSTRRYWTFVRAGRLGHMAWIRDSLGVLRQVWQENYGVIKSLWGRAR
jgi:hypothetical protein